MKSILFTLSVTVMAIFSVVQGALVRPARRDTIAVASPSLTGNQGQSADREPRFRRLVFSTGPVPAPEGEIVPRDDPPVGSQIYMQYPNAQEFQPSFEYDAIDRNVDLNSLRNDDGNRKQRSESFQKVYVVVEEGLKKFWDETDYCMVRYNQTQTVRNQAVVYCNNQYSIELWNKRPKDGPAPSDVRVTCWAAMIIAYKTIQEIFDENAPVFDRPDGLFKERRVLCDSWWSEDDTWGVSIAYREQGCPVENSNEWVELSKVEE
ncbi:hypothetical protein Dda_8335 [Drechslerella dactyloides]|uniref:Uncharacterized protein n=1 Tax=Drechslerella dactyloides TaxID=74499 RepID=A0AAD6IQ77_DREDA|nr:hypothetical protein Dda_8335 [Drechslerella dactyloides]